MVKIKIKFPNVETPDFAADGQWARTELCVAAYERVLGKWALYHALLDGNHVPDDKYDEAQNIFALLDFERRYRDGEFDGNKPEVLSGPSKHDIPSQIFRAKTTLEVYSCGVFAADDLKRLLQAWGDIKGDEKYKELSDDQQRAVETIIYKVNQSLLKRSATMSVQEG